MFRPSLVNTPLAEKFLNNDTKKSNAEARHPLQRIGSSEEIARMVAFYWAIKAVG